MIRIIQTLRRGFAKFLCPFCWLVFQFLLVRSAQATELSTRFTHRKPNGNTSHSPSTNRTLRGKNLSAETIRLLTGKLTDENDQPLPGVSIVVKGTTTGTTSKANGTFEIQAGDGPVTLVFSFMGYEAQEVVVTNQTVVNVKLNPTAGQLSEVVVVGYGTLDRKEVTSAISHISEKELLTIGANNPLMSLQGKVSGLTVANERAGDPNSNPSIQLRGVSSRSAGLGPLVIIDGIPGGNIQNVNQNDIASIDVLKDGAASAIYGTRGSNGVISITTKKGSDKPRVSYNGYATFDVASWTLKPLTVDEFLSKNRGTDFGARTDWTKEITRPYAFSQKHSLSFSGGNNRTNYRATLDYRKAEGLEIRSGRQEYGARLSLNHKSKNDLYQLSLNVAPRMYTRTDADYDSFNMALSLNPSQPVLNPTDPARYFDVQGSEVGAFNPVERLKTDQKGSEGTFLDWNGSVRLNILPSLNTQATLAQVNSSNFDFFFRPSTSTSTKFDGGVNSASREYNKNTQNSFEWITNYAYDTQNHSVKVLAGYSYQYFQFSNLAANNRGFSSDALTYNSLGNGTYNLVEGRNGMSTTKSDSKLIAFFGRVNYGFKDKYLVSASLRREGSSKFGINNKWGLFPAVSAGWRIAGESFMKTATWINDLKLRADYGVTGNQNFDNYLSLSLYQSYGWYLLNGSYVQSWGPANNINDNLRWERAKNMNIGLDFSLFNNAVQGSINYYNRRQQDLLGNYSVPLPPNIRPQTFANVGTLANSGIELQVSADVIKKEKFTYSISFAGATNSNKFISFSNDDYKGQSYIDVVSMPAPGSPGTAVRLQEGQRIGNFYMWKYAGADEKGNFLVYDKTGAVIPSAQAKEDDKQIVGNGLPKYTLSLSNSITYRNWDASVYFRGAFGYDLFNVHNFYYGLQSVAANTNVLKAAYDQNAHLNGPNTVAFLNDYFLEKGDYLKLDVVTIGYSIPAKVKYFESARVYASGRNLATITKFTGVNPETYPINGLYPGILTTDTGAGSKSYYPSTMQLMVGLQLNF